LSVAREAMHGTILVRPSVRLSRASDFLETGKPQKFHVSSIWWRRSV